MKVLLAGYNVDAEVLNEMMAAGGRRSDVTPETFSAGYARISRDPRPIDEIRKEARAEVERSRKSNETIIFKMGHHSVAEHAVFNFDIIGLSRYAMESLEKFRLCSYTEKSQRYITLQDDFVVPPELKGTPFETRMVNLIREQNALYHVLYEQLKAYVFAQNPALAADPKKHTMLEGWAKEDARYITSMATEAQVGLTVNARNLELMLRRFASSPLAEVRELGRTLYDKVKTIAPSIILFHEANDLDAKTYDELVQHTARLMPSTKKHAVANGSVRLVQYDAEGDVAIAAALMHSSSSAPYDVCYAKATHMTKEEKCVLMKTACAHLQLYDSLVREYEYASLTYEMVMAGACFGQIKRHRMATITTQPYDPALGVTVPPAITAIGKEKEFCGVVEKTNTLFAEIAAVYPHSAPYVLTNAHQRRVLVRTNVRELYHLSRLREDTHAQWDIREKTRRMSEEALKVMPLALMLIGGKDSFASVYERVYGCSLTIAQTVLPGARKIT